MFHPADDMAPEEARMSIPDTPRSFSSNNSPFEEVFQQLRNANDRIHILLDRLFRKNGLKSSSQYEILRILSKEKTPIRTRALAEKASTAVPGLTGVLNRLQDNGLVKRTVFTDDRRVILVSITIKGMELLQSLDAPLQNLQHELVEALTTNEMEQLTTLLKKLAPQPEPEADGKPKSSS